MNPPNPKVFTLGKFSVQVQETRDETKDYIPKDVNYIYDGKDKGDYLGAILSGAKSDSDKGYPFGRPVLIVGPTGCGKTAAVKYLAQQTNNAYRRVQLTGSTGVDEFVGKWLINKDGTFWVDGILVDAMKKGHWILLDEINACLPEILFVLHSVLDDDRSITLTDKDGEVVTPHPNFRIFATANPWEDYAGTKEMNKALKSRFPLSLIVNYPALEKEIKIVCSHTGMKDEPTEKSKESIVRRMVKVANIIRKKANKGHEMLFDFSTRELIYWGGLIDDHGVKKAAEYALLNKAEEEDRKKISDEINAQLRDDE